MGGGGSSQPSTPAPPPQPVIQYDPATSAAEAALSDAAKQSYASTVETEDEKAKKSALGRAPITSQQLPKRDTIRSAASIIPPTGGMGTSAVLTG